MPLEHPYVCERIGERGLYIGSARAAHPDVTDTTFGHVVTVSRSEQPLTTEFEPLVDGTGLDYNAFADAVETALDCYESDGPVLVHCSAGISRSAAVIATVIAHTEDETFEHALTEVQQYRDAASPRTALRDAGRQYLEHTPENE